MKPNTTLKESHDQLIKEYEIVTDNYNDLLKKYTNLEKINSELDYRFYLLEKAAQDIEMDILKVIEEDHMNFTEKYKCFVEEHQSLKIQSEESLNEIKRIHKELCQEIVSDRSLSVQVDSLLNDLYKSEHLRIVLHNTVQDDLKGCSALGNEEDQIINLTDDTCIEIRKCKESLNAISGRPADCRATFTFDRVFDEHCTQENIFEELEQLVQSALDGYDVCVFAYGQTGSGETYTMQGLDQHHMGITPCNKLSIQQNSRI